jgi:hypothetical protein
MKVDQDAVLSKNQSVAHLHSISNFKGQPMNGGNAGESGKTTQQMPKSSGDKFKRKKVKHDSSNVHDR